jgi:3-dehydroquinate dehydratase/shikimate dehydrogenase
LGPIIGNVFDYAGLVDDAELGRYSLQTLHEVFRYRTLNQETQVYALIGDPVEQSVGHLFHNAHFQHNAVYVKLRLAKDELPKFFSLAKELPFAGLSVTMPLKEAMDPTRPINTVVFREGKIHCFNTDGLGALKALERHTAVAGKKVAILGAGGTARAIAEVLRPKASVSIYNRTLERAQKISSEAHLLSELGEYDILINTIPGGYIPQLRPKTIVMDVNYSPKQTPLLKAAQELDCLCIYGEEMFVEQALLQQELFKKM